MHCGILAVDEYARASCNDTPFVIDDLYSRECLVVDTDAYPSKRSSPE